MPLTRKPGKRFISVCLIVLVYTRTSNSTSTPPNEYLTADADDLGEALPTNADARSEKPTLLADDIRRLYVVGMFPLSDHWWANYASVFPVIIEAAFQEMDRRQDILPGYQLELISKDTKGIPGLGTKRFYEAVSEPPKKLAVLGPSLSSVTELVSQSVQYWNLHEFLFSARTSSGLDRSAHPNLYMVNFVGHTLNPLKVELMKILKWTRVATLTTDSDIHKSETSAFHINLLENNFTLVTSGIIIGGKSVSDHVVRLKQYEARVIFASLSSRDAEAAFCEVYRHGLSSRLYTWILSGYSLYANWWQGGWSGCTTEQVSRAVDGSLTLYHKYLRHDDVITVSGRTAGQYQTWIETMNLSENQRVPRTAPFAYDAAWALGLVLNATLQKLPRGASLSDFDYDRADISRAIKEAITELNFEGVSGPVSFGKDGARNGYTYLAQLNSSVSSDEIAYFDQTTDEITWYTDEIIKWKAGHVPLDRFEHRSTVMSTPTPLIVGFGSLAAAGIIFAIGLLIFNCCNRKHTIIKMSSPYVNNIIILGGIITYAAVYAHGLQPAPNESIPTCMLKIWLTSLGFTIGFGAIFSKTWRVHVLFRTQSLQKKTMKDLELFWIVLLLVLVDVALLTLWTAFHPLQVTERNETYRDDEYIEAYTYRNCHNDLSVYWLGTIYIYKGLLLAFGVFLAWETKKVTIPALNDSKYIGFAIYNIVVVCLSGIPIVHSLSHEQLSLRFCVVAMLLIFCTTCTLCLVFVPKIQLVLSGQTGRVMFTANGSFSGRVQTADIRSNSVAPFGE